MKKKPIQRRETEHTNWIAMIPVDLIDEKELKDTFLIYPFAVSISKNWSPENSLTGIIDVILSPSDRDKICLQKRSYIENISEIREELLKKRP